MSYPNNPLRKYTLNLTMRKKSVKLYTDNVLKTFYRAVRTNKLDKLHIPHSDVYYVRAAIHARSGKKFPLQHVERIMREMGWKDT